MRLQKVLIADDDATMRINMAGLISWESYGYETPLFASDGAEALRLCREDPPDIVITDMKMPGMDGITFLKELKKLGQKPFILVISGYDDFSLVREAMREGASDYILKLELTGKKLLELLPGKTEQAQPSETSATERERVLRDIINHYFRSQTKMRLRMEEAGIRFEKDEIWCIFLVTDELFRFEDSTEEEYENLQRSFGNIVREVTADCMDGYEAWGRTGELYYFGCLKEEYAGREELLPWVGERLVSLLESYLGLTCHAGIAKGDASPEGLWKAAADAGEAIRMRYFTDEKNVLLWSRVKESFPSGNTAVSELRAELKLALSDMDQDALKAVMKKAREEMRSARPDDRMLLMVEFYGCAGEQIDYYGSSAEEELSLSTHSARNFMETEKSGGVNDWLLQLEAELLRWISGREASEQYSEVVKDACRRLREEYASPLTLTEMADELCVSSGYLSALMKKQTGKNFTEYLTDVRLSRAKELLLTTEEKQAVIAEMTGFSDPYYFSRQFKRAFGESPGAWRRSHSAQPEGRAGGGR